MRTVCHDHEGNEFPTIGAMIGRWNITRSAYDSRRAMGWDLEKILTTPVGAAYAATDHLGNGYPSDRDMCRAHGVPCNTFYQRLKSGMTLEQALTKKAPGKRLAPEPERTDHHGKIYPSLRAMCGAYGTNPNTYNKRRAAGMTVEQALTAEPQAFRDPVDGTEYGTKSDMCGAYGVKPSTVCSCMAKTGMAFEDAVIETAARQKKTWVYKDMTARTAKDLCARANPDMPVDIFLNRIRMGWDTARALEEPVHRLGGCTDRFGNAYGTVEAMCAAWHTNAACVNANIRKLGIGRDEALSRIASRGWRGNVFNGWHVTRHLEFPWFLCEDTDGREYVIHASELIGENDTA